MDFSWLNDIGTHKDRKIKRTKVPGFTICSCLTSDEGYETAVLDANGAHPVERYSCGNDAARGHSRWVERMTNDPPATIVMLGAWGGIVADEEITLVPFTDACP